MSDFGSFLSWVALGVGVLIGAAAAWLICAARWRRRHDTALRNADREWRAQQEDMRARATGLEADARQYAQRLDELRGEIAQTRQESAVARQEMSALGEKKAAAEARLDELNRAWTDERHKVAEERRRSEELFAARQSETEEKLRLQFKAMASEALKNNTDQFLTLANEKLSAVQDMSREDLQKRQKAIEAVVAPMRDSLGRVDEKISALEKVRGEAYGRLHGQVDSLLATQRRLEEETGNLVKALRAPAVRGRWGEIQLKRVVEMAGMVEHCDFSLQTTLSGQDQDDGRLRPDMVVRLPGKRHVVVDAKVPLESYLEAMSCQDPDGKLEHLKSHARQVRAHLTKLGGKNYWERLPGSPEFVVLFLPGESFYSAALEAAPSLIEEAVSNKVLIATPTTLIALLHTIALGWREEKLAENAQLISAEGRILHKNVVTFAEHWAALGRSLGQVTKHYNASIGSLEKRVVPSARRLEELGAGSDKDMPEQLTLTTRPRLVASMEGEGRGSGLARTAHDNEGAGLAVGNGDD